MYDACRCCTLPKMRMCARTSNMEIAKTKQKIPEEQKGLPKECAGLGNVVALRRK
jgi:hypothetical protein